MAQHALIDAAGNVLSFLDDRLHSELPAGAVALTPAQYAQWITNPKGLVWSAATSALVAAPAPASKVPSRISAYQFKAQLLAMPSTAPFNTVLDAAAAWATSAGGLTALQWTDATTIRRVSPIVAQMAAHFSWSSEQVDQMFILAAAIEAP